MTIPFIQVTCAGVEFPIRQTVSWAGTEPDEEDGVLLDPHPAARAVRAEAARMAAAAFLFLTFAVSLRVVQAQGGLSGPVSRWTAPGPPGVVPQSPDGFL